jgi:hypothetical protein
MSKAHYMFQIYDEEKKIYGKIYSKIRSFKYDKEIEFFNPIYHLLYHLMDNDPNSKFEIKNGGVYYQKKLISAWRESLIEVKKYKKVSSYRLITS